MVETNNWEDRIKMVKAIIIIKHDDDNYEVPCQDLMIYRSDFDGSWNLLQSGYPIASLNSLEDCLDRIKEHVEFNERMKISQEDITRVG